MLRFPLGTRPHRWGLLPYAFVFCYAVDRVWGAHLSASLEPPGASEAAQGTPDLILYRSRMDFGMILERFSYISAYFEAENIQNETAVFGPCLGSF